MGTIREVADLLGGFAATITIGHVNAKLEADGLATILLTFLVGIAMPLMGLAL